MKLTRLPSLLTLLPLVGFVAADWDLWTGTCAAPSGGDDPTFSQPSVGTYSQWACNGYTIIDEWDFYMQFTTVNPCNTAETIVYKPNNGKWFNIYVQGQESASQQIGVCFPGDLTSADCYYGLTACLCNRYISCTSTHCN